MRESIPTFGGKENVNYLQLSDLEVINDLKDRNEELKDINGDISLDKSIADDSYKISQNILKKNYYSNEEWDSTVSIPGIVVDIEVSNVIVECLIDSDKKFFQIRRFDKQLFNDFENLHPNSLLLIKIKTKSGSFRIDIYDGKGIVNKSLFDYEGDWNGIDNSLSQSLSEINEINL